MRRPGLLNTLRAADGIDDVGVTEVDGSGWEGERRDESDDGGAEVVRDGLPVTGRLGGTRATPRRTTDSVGAGDGCDILGVTARG